MEHNSDGIIERLVIFGNHQVECIDYTETFTLVAKMFIVPAFLAIVADKNWEFHQMDAHNTFLQGNLDQEVYMKPPLVFTPFKPGLVCRLRNKVSLCPPSRFMLFVW